MNLTSNDSVYGLITRLCEHFCKDKNPDNIKHLRSESYEYLLGRKLPIAKQKDYEGTTSATSNLICWQIKLGWEHGLWDHAENLRIAVESMEELYKLSTAHFNSILRFLLCLKKLPKEESKARLFSFESDINFNSLFRLPKHIICDSSSYCDNSYYLRPRTMQLEESPSKCSCTRIFSCRSFETISLINLGEKEINFNNSSKESIWELASTLKYSHRRSWENFGLGEPDKEVPFLSELGDLSTLWIANLPSLYVDRKLRGTNIVRSLKLKSKMQFLKDLQYLLLGITSDSFACNQSGTLYLVPGLIIHGVTPNTLKSYCEEFLFAGNCHKALKDLSTRNLENGKYKYDGFIFKEFCKGIQRFLEFYRVAVFSFNESTMLLLEFDGKIDQIRKQVATLTKICKVGPFQAEENIPNGVALLNYLYEEVMSTTDKQVILILYSILFACFQVYISRFLSQWILEGSINDPFGEYFIKAHLFYNKARNRHYWGRNFCVNENLVPNFLKNLRSDIFNCGKAMSLLKLCVPNSTLLDYLTESRPPIFSCCVTSNQLKLVKQNTTRYYLEVIERTGAKLNIERILSIEHEENPILLELIARKQLITLKRLEMEHQLRVHDEKERRIEAFNVLKEQYDIALMQKQMNLVQEIDREMKIAADIISNEKMRAELIKKESLETIAYYANLCEMATERKRKAEENLNKFKKALICYEKSESNAIEPKSDESNDSFHSVSEIAIEIETKNVELDDIINANATPEMISAADLQYEEANSNIQIAIDNLATTQPIRELSDLQKNRLKVMNPQVEAPFIKSKSNFALTDAQRNKLRVLSSEFGIELVPVKIEERKSDSDARLNKAKMLGSSDWSHTDNANGKEAVETGSSSRLPVLTIDLRKATPMSVDSTPVSEMPQSSTLTTPTTGLTGGTQFTDDGFNFPLLLAEITPSKPAYYETSVFTTLVARSEVSGLNTNCLPILLNDCISIPLNTHLQLVNNELLKYFMCNLKFFDHLNSLRNYFFLQDGEFSRNITENLFDKLYNATRPSDLINIRTLNGLVFNALSSTCKMHTNQSRLSFKINEMPASFELGNPNVLDCISLTYKIDWPLNIVLSSRTIEQYDLVFKYLLQLQRVSWALKMIFLELKVLAKESGKKEIYLMASEHYRRLHQSRHVMLHFVQTFQSYVVGEVLHNSWDLFKKEIISVTNIDEVYEVHVAYVKNILLMCLISKKTPQLGKIVQKIFRVILKFFDYLRRDKFRCEAGAYVHPNFDKLMHIFYNFQEIVLYFMKAVRKIAFSAYQPHLNQLLNMLNVNDFYSQMNLVASN